MSQTDPTPQLVERLLSRGLDLYGRNAVDEAVRCWQEVLQLQPSNAQALDYLDAAGAPYRVASVVRPTALVVDLNAVRQRLAGTPASSKASAQPLPSATRAVNTDEQSGADVAQLIDAGHYEQALQQLYAMRSRKPDDTTLTECIRLLRDRLLGQYWDTLGHLDRIPVRTESSKAELSVEEERVLSHLDGRSSLLEIIESCQLGRLATSRVLCDLLTKGSLGLPGEPSERDRVSVERVVTGAPTAPEGRLAVDAGRSETREELAPATARSGGGYEELFRDATCAYISRRYELASQLFNECLRQRPEDSRVLHNLRQLERRL